ncbi:MAG: oxidoreductase [Planctomycetaceae bacterium]|nr:oxidoreductase [Planctomycetaceae bacterium]
MNQETVWLDNEHPALRKCWHPVARSEDAVEGVPLQVELLGEFWCVLRLDGQLAAFPDVCPHRLATLSEGSVVDGTLQCGYHGYRYAMDGKCVKIPAQSPSLPIPPRANCQMAAGIQDHLGLVWLAPDEPLVGLPEVPEHDDPNFVNCPLEPWEWNASAAQMADNFLDLGHFPFLHLATFGVTDDEQVPDYDMERSGLSVRVEYSHATKALADSMDNADDFRQVERHDVFVFTPPHHVYIYIDYADENAVLAISFAHQPVNASTTRLFCTDYRNDIEDTAEARLEATKFQLAVGAEDKALLERSHFKAVPLDQRYEVHTKADRVTLEMRRILTDLVALASE